LDPKDPKNLSFTLSKNSLKKNLIHQRERRSFTNLILFVDWSWRSRTSSVVFISKKNDFKMNKKELLDEQLKKVEMDKKRKKS
jgi:hypothetical protein